jgi:hypothetical protein
LFAANSAEEKDPFSGNDTELVEVKSRKFDSVLQHPSSRLEGKNIFVSVVGASFSKKWEKQFGSDLTPGYKDRISSDYASMLIEEFSAELQEKGFKITGDPAKAAGLVLVRISDIRINGPELVGHAGIRLTEAGSAMVTIDLIGMKDEVLYRIKDRSRTRYRQQGFTANRSTNYRDFRNMMKAWGKKYSKFLADDIKANSKN